MDKNKIKASFIMGAIGDALGAPIEGIFNLATIKEKYGDKGLTDIIGYKSHFEDNCTFEAGSITDDTTMAMTTAIALIKTAKEMPIEFSDNFLKKLNYYTWQGYLNWAKEQIYYPLGDKLIDKSIKWDNLAKDFWFACGAGKGTLAALCQESYGTLEKPLNFEYEINGKKIKTPNLGCGGMMRIAPLAFIPNFTDREIFETACHNAAITHSGQSAYVTTGITALFISNANKNLSMPENIESTKSILNSYSNHPLFKEGIEECIKAINYASSLPITFKAEDIDNIPKQMGYKNAFLAIPVLAQVTYAMLHTDKSEKIKDSMILSANHSGDSDSVAAIFGNIVGARYGETSIVKKWEDKIILKEKISKIAKKISA